LILHRFSVNFNCCDLIMANSYERGSSIYDERIEEEIPGTFYVVSIIETEQDETVNPMVSHPEEYDLPINFVLGEQSSGGVCAFSLLNVLKENATDGESPTLTWGEALDIMQEEIRDDRGLEKYTPTLSTSRPIDVRTEPIRIASSSSEGVKRALLIGVHYEKFQDDDSQQYSDDEYDDNEDAKLSSCQDDVRKLREYLVREEGFEKQNILVVMDDNGRHHEPTKEFIMDCLKRLCDISEAGDSIFVHFSGHGGRLLDEDEDIEDGIPHELLAPSDYRRGGVLMDDELYAQFVRKVSAGVHVVAVIDTCQPSPFSCALELPYVCGAGEDEVHDSGGFRSGRAIMAAAAAGAAAVGSKKKKTKEKKYDESESGSEDEDESGDESMEVEDSDDEEEESKKSKTGKKSTKKKKSKGEKESSSEEDDESGDESMEVEDSDDEEEESKKSKTGKKSTKKKKSKGEKKSSSEEEEDEEETEKPKPENKSKKKKKKGEEEPPAEKIKAENKSKKKKKGKGEEESSSKDEAILEEEEKPKKKKKKGASAAPSEKEDKKKKKTKKKKEVSGLSGEEDEGGIDDEEDPQEKAPKKKKKEKKDTNGIVLGWKLEDDS